MSAHTPGPWHIGKANNPTEPGVRCGVRSEDWIVADVWEDSSALKESSEANARLIAAAPDMLAALQAILPFVPPEHAKMSMVGSLAHLQAANDVRAAIAKATGAQ